MLQQPFWECSLGPIRIPHFDQIVGKNYEGTITVSAGERRCQPMLPLCDKKSIQVVHSNSAEFSFFAAALLTRLNFKLVAVESNIRINIV